MMKWFLCFLLVLFIQYSNGQNPLRFEYEVTDLMKVQHQLIPEKETLVFAGSSSFRMWDEMKDEFSEYNVINSGFGGSHMSDLLYYTGQLILKHDPAKVFVYEGDNDLESGKTPNQIIITTKELINKIKNHLPKTKIYLLSAKPSPSRWYLKESYEKLNDRFEMLANKQEGVYYVDVWDLMLTDAGKPFPGIFLEDSLHMNRKGYDLWAKEILKYLIDE